MELSPGTVAVYARQAVIGMQQSLDRFDDDTVNVRPHGARTNSAAALITHSCAAATFWFEHVGLGREVDRDRGGEFEAEATVAELRRLLDETAVRLTDLAGELDQVTEVPESDLREFLHGGDRSDASLVLHALEELFQHLGHLELTADAVGRST